MNICGGTGRHNQPKITTSEIIFHASEEDYMDWMSDEITRQKAVIAELVKSLENSLETGSHLMRADDHEKARALIAKHEGKP